MTKEDIAKALRQNYIEKYKEYKKSRASYFKPNNNRDSLFKEIGDDFIWKSIWNNDEALDELEKEGKLTKDERQEIECKKNFIQELAIEGNPEAYLEARRFLPFRNNHTDICTENTQNLFPPYGGIWYYKKFITESINRYIKNHQGDADRYRKDYKKALEAEANVNARLEWRRERERIFCGSTETYEEDETWNHIKADIIPYATLDIWESLYEFYNDKEACVPPRDRNEFNELYEKYLNNNADYQELCSKNGTSTQKKKKDSTVETLRELVKCGDINYLITQLQKKHAKIKFENIAVAYFVKKMIPQDEELYDDLICNIFENADEKDCRKLIDGLHLINGVDKEDQIPCEWIRIRRILCKMNVIPQSWENIIVEQFNNSMRNAPALVGWWISFLYDCNLFYKYVGKSYEFWRGIPYEKTSDIVSIVRSCIADETVLFNLYTFITDNREIITNGDKIYEILQRECANYVCEKKNSCRAIEYLVTSTNCLCRNRDDWNKFSENIYYAIKSKYTTENNITEARNLNMALEIAESINTLELPIHDMSKCIKNIEQQNAAPGKIIDELHERMQDITDKLSYCKDYWENKK